MVIIFKGYDRALVNFVETFNVNANSNDLDSTGLKVHKTKNGMNKALILLIAGYVWFHSGTVILPKALQVKTFQVQSLQFRIREVMAKVYINIYY